MAGEASGELEKLKEDRKQGRKRVDKAVKKLSDGITKFKYSKETLYQFVLELETELKVYNEISDCFKEGCDEEGMSDEYCKINNLDINQYDEKVVAKYQEGKSMFETHVLNLQSAPLTSALQTPPAQPTQNANPPTHTPTYMQKLAHPTFSGYHKDWPEFDSLWLKMMPGHYQNKTVLAHILKKSLSGGPGKDVIAHISAGADNAYDLMWKALKSHYGNVTLCVSAALSEVRKLPSVSEGDLKGTVDLIRAINQIYLQLQQVKQVTMVTAREVNDIYTRLPADLKREWSKIYTALDSAEQLHPFEEFHTFLESSLKTALLMYELDTTFSLAEPEKKSFHARTSERYPEREKTHQRQNNGSWRSSSSQQNSYQPRSSQQNSYQPSSYRSSPNQEKRTGTAAQEDQKTDNLSNCIIHPNVFRRYHTTKTCRQFLKLTPAERRKLVLEDEVRRCKRCFGPYPCKCADLSPCDGCGTGNHHPLICHIKAGNPPKSSVNTNSASTNEAEQENVSPSSDESDDHFGGYTAADATSSCATKIKKERGCLAIYSTPVKSSEENASVFCDDGSDASWIADHAIKKLKAKKIDSDRSLNMTTLHGTEEIKCALYEVTLIAADGKETSVVAYSTPSISSDVADFNPVTIAKIFPGYDVSKLRRPTGPIDLLLGADYFSLHPKHEVLSNGDLSIMRGELGVCLQGRHPLINDPMSQKCYSTCISQPLSATVNDFILADQLGTEIAIKCGSCRCGRCPIPGHTYSFTEEQELNMIRENLYYVEERERWRTSYPWKTDPVHLPDNYPAALATLISTEKKLKSDPEWAKTFAEQIAEHEERGVARKLTPEELAAWKGPKYYLSAMAVEQPKSLTTPVRLVMNSSQNYRGVSLNSFLAKGPEAYNNSMMRLLLIFREQPVVIIGDIRKMYNSIELEQLETHCHRFLWRDLEDRTPDVWAITRVNLGDRPSGTISIVARDLTADKFQSINPEAAEMIKNQTFTDDTINSVESIPTAKKLADDASSILRPGGFRYKEWITGGINPEDGSIIPNETVDVKTVLGSSWDLRDDTIIFPSKINFSAKKRKQRTEPNVTLQNIHEKLPPLTRRIVLEQTMGIYDPYGILAPLVLKAKILLRDTWILQMKWDEVLPDEMQESWTEFFKEVIEAEKMKYPRCLRPANAVGDPSLIILSDGSETAYGCTAYIQWDLPDGSCWTRLILAKTRITPIKRISIPQTELNGAVVNSRIRKFVEKESRFNFKQVVQLVDSTTVFQQIHSLSTKFQVYEGVRVGEIQRATDGDLSSWAWIQGKDNIGDWATRVKSPDEIGPDSEWFNGPAFMRTPISTWNIKFDLKTEIPRSLLPGEKAVTHACSTDTSVNLIQQSMSRNSDIKVVRNAYALVLLAIRSKSFKASKHESGITPELLKDADKLFIRDAQSGWTEETANAQFKTLNPVLWYPDGKKKPGIFVVGTRIAHTSPLTPENKPQVLLPPKCLYTKRLMTSAHEESCHHGRDKTLARFRAKYWTSHAAKLAASTCSSCQMCRLIKADRMKQEMGAMPPERLMPAPPFTASSLDLFGPFYIRGEVQKKTTGKAWGLMLTDMCCRAVHIELIYGYSTEQFMLGLSRFAALRGWPSFIYSDPGSQLKGAEDDLSEVWRKIDLKKLQALGAQKGLKWSFGPTDAPWYQGTVESLIKIAKKAISLAVGTSRLSGPELLTVMTEAANLINERPIGYMPSSDSTINILTPNSLLLGRSTAINPGGYDPHPSLRSRVTLVQKITDQFWQKWIELYAPTLVHQSKWRQGDAPLKKDDVVMVMESNLLKNEYRLARVHEPIVSSDGKIRRVKLAYKNFKIGEAIHEYSGAKDKIVERSVQSLSLLAPVEKSRK